jgi:putative membrane protein
MVYVFCALAAIGYWLGGRRPVRVIDARHRWTARHWRAAAFAAGLAIVVIDIAGPVDALVRQSLSLRTTQMIVLAMVASPLIVLGAPLPRWKRLIGLSARGAERPTFLGALLAFGLFNGALVLAYVPAISAATASAGWARQAGQLLIVALGVAFWSEVIAQPPGRCALPYIGRVAYLFLSSGVLRVLGVVLGFASAPFYAVSLFDQQVAAGILLVPGVLTDLIVLTVCLYLWLGQDERAPRRATSGGTQQRAIG